MKKTSILLLTIMLLLSCNSNKEEIQNSTGGLNLDNTGTITTEQNIDETNSGANEIQSSSGETHLVLQNTGLEIELANFNDIYKQALFNSGQGNEISITQIKTCIEQWGNIISKYRGYEVVGFEKSENLDKDLIEIGIVLLTASDFSTSGKLDIAHSELEKVRMKIMEIRQINNIKSISDDMLLVHNKMEELVENPDVKDTKKIDELKSDIQKLKEYNQDKEEYKKMLSDFENTVNVLSSLKGAEYKTKLSELKPSFIKMYMKFG